VVTGDIAEVGGQPNFVDAIAAQAGLLIDKPLWHAPRRALLEHLVAKGYAVVFSAVRTPWFDASWAGRRLDAGAIAELLSLGAQSGLDLCGENGEYHTMVVDAPRFRAAIVWDTEQCERVGELSCLRVLGARLRWP
jgi:diphthamide synthase (EF-2-diphthine--ammonia ligase)